MGEFDHYHDMNHDGKVDSYDRAVFHDLMDQENGEYRRQRPRHNPNEILPRDLTPEQRQQLRDQQQAEDIARWVLGIFFALVAWICFKNLNGFTALLGLFSVLSVIRILTL